MKNVILFFVHYFDTIDDVVSAIMSVFSIAVLTTMASMFTFISASSLDYVLLAFFGVVGQTAMYFAKIRFPDYFGKHDDKKTIGTKILHYVIDCFLAALFSILCTEYLIDFIFTLLSFVQNVPSPSGEPDYKRIIFGAILVGAFYETILKKAIKKNREIDKS
jgi:hypothetical protein